MKMLIAAAGGMVGGMVVGYLFCTVLFRHAQKAARARRVEKREAPNKLGVMDMVLILEAVILVAYTTAALVVFWHTGEEPAVLTGCVFGVCGMENGVMGWIKTNKDKNAG